MGPYRELECEGIRARYPSWVRGRDRNSQRNGMLGSLVRLQAAPVLLVDVSDGSRIRGLLNKRALRNGSAQVSRFVPFGLREKFGLAPNQLLKPTRAAWLLWNV